MGKFRIGKDSFALKNTKVFGIAVVLLFTLGIVLLPGEKFGRLLLGKDALSVDAECLGNAIFRAVGFAVMVLLALDMGLDIFGFRSGKRGWLLSLPFIVVAVNNAPIVGWATGEVTLHATAASYALFTVNCLFVGLFEEIVFRGVILPLVLRQCKNTRVGVFLALLISSALFGAVHLVNIFSNPVGAVILQIGYSFLIGLMCGMVMLLTRNVFACAFLHALYNFGGLIADSLGSGQVWNATNITLTAVIGVLAVGYGVYLLLCHCAYILQKNKNRICGLHEKDDSKAQQDDGKSQ